MSVSEAAERLRRIVPIESGLWEKTGNRWTQEDKDLWRVAGALLHELDPTPVDEEWARGVAVKYVLEFSWDCGDCYVTIAACAKITNPTRGQVRTIYRGLFGQALKEDGR